MKRILTFLSAAVLLLSACAREYDVCVYGGTASGVMASYAAAEQGAKVLLIGPDVTIGGMTTGGLGWTDIGNKQAVVGLAREFYRRIGSHYGKLEQWIFEPHVAEDILEEYLDHRNITVVCGARLSSVQMDGTKIVALIFEDGQVIRARSFIDCSYEGDLMAYAGVSYIVGREDNSVYGEDYDGSQLMKGHQFPDGVDPFVVPGEPESGLLWGISDNSLKEDGTGDDYVQAYNYRICLTDDPENMIPITRPERYDSTRYELLLRLFEAMPQKRSLNDYFIWSRMPNHKTDINNRGGFSTDLIGMNHSYPEASWAQRDSILQEHMDYTLGLLYFYGHDPRVPDTLRIQMLQWGLPKDEYVRTNHWTHQLYVREARRMIGEYVATQADCLGHGDVHDGIALAAYNMDSHNCERLVIQKDGQYMVKNEGNVEISGGYPYPVSYRSITPKREECTNLLVPVCLSASHIAYGSIRMEPVFMATGQAAGIAAAYAVKKGIAMQEVSSEFICGLMASDDILIDDADPTVDFEDGWYIKKGRIGYGPSYLEIRPGYEGSKSITYHLPSNLKGKYSIYSYRLMGTNMNPVTDFEITCGDTSWKCSFNIADLNVQGQTSGEWYCLGCYDLDGEATVKATVSNPEFTAREDALLLVRQM